jgi:putative tryptophan/tyrosine transport system substrate-binding protein
MRRRAIITLLGGAAAWPLTARAQQPDRMRRVGVLMGGPATDSSAQSYLAAFIQGLRESGWNGGRNLQLDVRWNPGDAGLAQIYAAQLIGLMPDVILAATTINLVAIRQATNAVPVVFTQVADPVGQGFVQNIKQPSGMITGFSLLEFSLGGKWIDLLNQAVPGLRRVAFMFHTNDPISKFFVPAIEAAAQAIGAEVIAAPLRSAADVEPAVTSLAGAPNGGLVVQGDPLTALHQKLIIDLARRYHLPSISPQQNFIEEGGLIAYGPSTGIEGQFRQAASYVDRILRGMKPGDLPVQAPTNYTLAINLKTAKMLDLTVPPTLLAIADKVIE